MSIQDIANIHEHVGDHVRVKRLVYNHHVYNHHALVVKVIDDTTLLAIHYTSSDSLNSKEASSTVASSGFSETAKVFEIEMKVDPEEDTIELLEYSEGVALFTGEKAVERARDRIDEKNYNLFTNNCECLINWAITGNNVSKQGENGMKLIAGATAIGVGVGVGTAAILYLDKKNKKTD